MREPRGHQRRGRALAGSVEQALEKAEKGKMEFEATTTCNKKDSDSDSNSDVITREPKGWSKVWDTQEDLNIERNN